MTSTNSTLSPPKTTSAVLLSTAATITPSTSNSTNVQPGPSARVDPMVLGLAAGIPSIVALILGIILAVICIRQRTSCRCNEANQSQEGPEECNYEPTLPKLAEASYLSLTKDPAYYYEKEDPKPPRRLPPPIPKESNGTGNIKQGASPAGKQSPEVNSEAVYEIHVPFAITEKRAKNKGWD